MGKVDVQIVNPPSPDGEIYIRDICRWGRKSREGMIWPQTSLAYLAAMVPEDMTPVNTFRLVLNHYFGVDLDLLPNDSYFSSYARLYDLHNVTKHITAQHGATGN